MGLKGGFIYNTGGAEGAETSSTGAQLNDFHFSKAAVLEAALKKTFSQLGTRTIQPKHYGVTFKKYREYPILHKANVNDQGIDADGVTMDSTKWYAWDASGTRTEHPSAVTAKASVGQVRIQSGQGNIYGSDRDFLVQKGSFPILREEGGVVNTVGVKRTVITAKIKRFGFGIRYTKAAMDLDTDASLAAKNAIKLGEAYGDIRESQIRTDLLEAGMVNATYSGGASTIGEVDETCELTYADLRRKELALDLARCPISTKMVTGSTKIATTTIPASRYAYVPFEMKPTLEDITSNGRYLWKDVSEYADGATAIAEGEIGKIGKTRFIEVYEMPTWKGGGADATDGADGDGDGIEDSGAGMYTTDGKYDVHPILWVGSESFETLGLEGDIARVVHAKPKANPDTDMFGDKGSMAISWYYGIILNKNEHISCHFCSAKK